MSANKDYELEAILAEFSSYSDSLRNERITPTPAPAPAPKPKAEPVPASKPEPKAEPIFTPKPESAPAAEPDIPAAAPEVPYRPEPEWAPVTLASSAPADEEEVWQSVPVSPRAKAPAGEPGERPRKKAPTAPTALGVLSSLGLAFGRLRESFRLTDAAPEPPAPLSPARQRLNRRLGIVCAVLSLLTVLNHTRP